MGETGERPATGRFLLVTATHSVPGAGVDAIELERLSWSIEVCRLDARDEHQELESLVRARD